MTIDITPLARMARRMDVSATLKSFLVVAAFLLVLTNIGRIYSFALAVIRSQLLDSETRGVFLAAIAALLVAALGPLAFVVWDWVARRPWRHLAAVTGAALGALGFAAVGAMMAGLVEIMVEEPEMMWEELLALPLYALMSLGAALIGQADPELEAGDYLTFALLLLALGSVAWVLVRAVHHRVILSGDRPRELLLGAIHRGGLWARLAFLAGLPSSLWRFSALAQAAFWAFLFARPLVYAGVVLWQRVGAGSTALTLAGGAALVAGGHFLFHAGKRLAARDIWRPERADGGRAPVLFLRSFKDDHLDFKRPWWALAGRWYDHWSFRHDLDQTMVDEIAQYGPVVALGMPGEESIPFGAMRHYATHDSWQAIVEDTASRARSIVIAAGSTPGVRWEYELLARKNLLRRTLLLFPPPGANASAGKAALRAFEEAIGTDLDVEIPADRQPIALLHTEAGPCLLTARQTTAAAYLVAVRAHFQGCTAGQLADPLTP